MQTNKKVGNTINWLTMHSYISGCTYRIAGYFRRSNISFINFRMDQIFDTHLPVENKILTKICNNNWERLREAVGELFSCWTLITTSREVGCFQESTVGIAGPGTDTSKLSARCLPVLPRPSAAVLCYCNRSWWHEATVRLLSEWRKVLNTLDPLSACTPENIRRS